MVSIFVSLKLFEISRIIFSLDLTFSHLRMSIDILASVCKDDSDMKVKPSDAPLGVQLGIVFGLHKITRPCPHDNLFLSFEIDITTLRFS